MVSKGDYTCDLYIVTTSFTVLLPIWINVVPVPYDKMKFMIFTRRKFFVASAAVAVTAITAFAAPVTEPPKEINASRASLITILEDTQFPSQMITADPEATVSFPRETVTSVKKPEPKPEPKKEAPKPEPAPAPAPAVEEEVIPAEAPPAEALTAAAEAPASTGDTSIEASKEFARATLASKGMGAGEFTCLDNLWERESNWNFQADNPSSDAYGIPQSLPGEKMAEFGADWATNPQTQIKWGISYIEGRYGTPCNAWGHSETVGWY